MTQGLPSSEGKQLNCVTLFFAWAWDVFFMGVPLKVSLRWRRINRFAMKEKKPKMVLTTVFALVAISGIYELLTLAVSVQFADSCFFKLRHEQPSWGIRRAVWTPAPFQGIGSGPRACGGSSCRFPHRVELVHRAQLRQGTEGSRGLDDCNVERAEVLKRNQFFQRMWENHKGVLYFMHKIIRFYILRMKNEMT